MKVLKNLSWNKILFVFMTILVILFCTFIGTSNILPIKYFLFLLLIFLLWIVLLYFLLIFKVEKKKNNIRKIIGSIVSIILIVIMSLIFYYLSNTLAFFKNFGASKFTEENYLILVRSDSEYKLSDLKDIGYIPNELSNINEALTKLDEQIILDKKEYQDYIKLFMDLIDHNITSVLIEESYMKMIEENGEYDGLFKTLYTVVIQKEIENDSKEVDVTKDTFTIYISGIDTYGSISSVSRSDVNIIATINPKTKQILLVSIPRDYYVQLRGTTGYKDKLTHAGLYGIDTSIGTLEDLLNIDINYYFRVNFSTLEKVIDAIGGVDVYSKYSFTSTDNNHFFKGYNHMNGKQALSFSRERHALPGGDRTRGENQQAVIDGIIRKATSSAIITKYTSVLDSLEGSFQTNMTEEDILKLIRMQLDDMAKWNVTSYSLNGTNAEEYTYSYSAGKLYVMKPLEDTIDQAVSLINKVKAGEMLEASYGEVSNIKNPTYVEPVVPDTSNESTPDTNVQNNEEESSILDIPGILDDSIEIEENETALE